MDDVGRVIAGFVAGVSELPLGLTFFVGDKVMEVLKPFSTSPGTAAAISNYTTAMAIVTIGLIVVNFLIGYWGSMVFSCSFLIGDLLMIALLAGNLMKIAPPVLTSMVISFIAVLAGILLRIYIESLREKRRRQSQMWY